MYAWRPCNASLSNQCRVYTDIIFCNFKRAPMIIPIFLVYKYYIIINEAIYGYITMSDVINIYIYIPFCLINNCLYIVKLTVRDVVVFRLYKVNSRTESWKTNAVYILNRYRPINLMKAHLAALFTYYGLGVGLYKCSTL